MAASRALSPVTPKPPRPLRIGKRVRDAIEAMVTGDAKTQAEAAAIVGLNRSHLCKTLRKPHVRSYLESRTRDAIVGMQTQAAGVVQRLLGGAKSEHVMKDVALSVLGMNGMRPVEATAVRVNVDIAPGYVIKLKHVEQASEGVVLDLTPIAPDAA